MAPLGTGPARQFTVTGSPVNLVARLREHAPVGGVLVSEETRRAARDVVVYVAQAPLDVKGFDGPVTAWASCAVASAPGRPLSRAPFVGRERERSLLRSTWTAVRQSEDPRVVTVLGPPWIGKSGGGLGPLPALPPRPARRAHVWMPGRADDEAEPHAWAARTTLDAFAAALTGGHRTQLMSSPAADLDG